MEGGVEVWWEVIVQMVWIVFFGMDGIFGVIEWVFV